MSGRELGKGFSRQREQYRRERLETGSSLARLKRVFFWRYNKVPGHERPYATMFGFFLGSCVGEVFERFCASK